MQSKPKLGLRSSTFACCAAAAMALVASAPTGIVPPASAFHKSSSSSSSSSSCCWDATPGWKKGAVSICTTQGLRGANVHLGGGIGREGDQQQRVVHGGGVRCAVEEAATAPLVVPDTVPRTPAPWWVSPSLSLSPLSVCLLLSVSRVLGF